MNGKQISLPKTAEVNGHRENEFYRIGQNDDIRIRNSYTVKEIAEFLDVPLGADIRVNDTAAQPDTRVYEHFTVSWDMKNPLPEGSYADLPDADTEEDAYREEPVYGEGPVMQKAEAVAGEAAMTQGTETAAENGTASVTTQGTSGKQDEKYESVEQTAQSQSVAPQGPHPLTVIVNHSPITMQGKASYLVSHNFYDKYTAMGCCCCMNAVDSVCCNIYCTLEPECHICTPDIIVDGLRQMDDIQTFFS